MAIKFLLVTFLFLFINNSAVAINLQHFSRSSSLIYEKLDDAILENSFIDQGHEHVFHLGLTWVDMPLTVKNSSNDTQLTDILTNMASLPFGLAWYIKPSLLIGAKASYNTFKSKNGDDGSGFADLDAYIKWRLIHKKNWALALIPRMSFNVDDTESEVQGTGFANLDGLKYKPLTDEGIGYGLNLAYEHRFSWLQFVANLGYKMSDKAILEDIGNQKTMIDLTQQIRLGVGSYIPVNDSFGVNVEFTKIWSNPLFNDDINPNELYAGLNSRLTEKIRGYLGASLGNVFSGEDGNDIRISGGIKFFLPKTKQNKNDVKVLKEAPTEQLVVAPVVNCEDVKVFAGSNTITLRFGHAQSDINKDLRLQEAAQFIYNKINKIEKVNVYGHTSAPGRLITNSRLSIRRANKVKDFLQSKGVPAEKISSVGMGETALLDKANNEVAHTKNRRVEIEVLLRKDFKSCQ